MSNQIQHGNHNHLKDMDFLAWNVTRTNAARKATKISKILSSRPRERSKAHVN